MKIRSEIEMKKLGCPFLNGRGCMGSGCAAFEIRDDVVRASDLRSYAKDRPVLGLCLMFEKSDDYAGI